MAKRRDVDKSWQRKQEPRFERKQRSTVTMSDKQPLIITPHRKRELMQAFFIAMEGPEAGRQAYIALIETLPPEEQIFIAEQLVEMLIDKTSTTGSVRAQQSKEMQEIERAIFGKYEPGHAPYAGSRPSASGSGSDGYAESASDFEDEEDRKMASDREYLFVGGPGAGQRQRIPPEHDRFRVRDHTRMPDAYVPGKIPEFQAAQVSTYVKLEINVGGLPFEVFAEQKDGKVETAANAVIELLTHYRPHAHDGCRECEHHHRHKEHTKNGRR